MVKYAQNKQNKNEKIIRLASGIIHLINQEKVVLLESNCLYLSVSQDICRTYLVFENN